MKKTTWIIWVLTILFALGAVNAFAAGDDIGKDQAKATALEASGLKEKELDWVSVNEDREDGVYVYEVKFNTDGVEYDYTIDAQSGEILQWEMERWNVEEGEPVELEQAKSIALENAGVNEDEVVFSQAKQKKDDGRAVFSIEFFVEEQAEYEYKIDLATGTILELSYERWDAESARAFAKQKPASETSANTAAEPDGTIGVEKAKAIALEKVGLSEDEVVFSKAKLDRDDGRLEYDIEFFVAGEREYEFEIDANTGEILGYESERWGDD